MLEDPSPDLGGEATTKEQSGQALTTFGVRCGAAGPVLCQPAGIQHSFVARGGFGGGAKGCVLRDLWSAGAGAALACSLRDSAGGSVVG